MSALRCKALVLAGALVALVAVPLSAQDKDEANRKVKVNKYLITAEEIVDRAEMSTAYDVVKLLRPNFLKQTSLKSRITSGYSMGASRGPELGTCRRDCPDGGGTGSGSSGGSGSTGSSGAGTQGTAGSTPRGGPEMGSLDDNNRGMVSAVLYVDDMRQPTLDATLRTIRAADVFEIRYLNATEALGKYGSGHEGGAVLLKTKRMPAK